jgi:hypothetical protein
VEVKFVELNEADIWVVIAGVARGSATRLTCTTHTARSRVTA